MTDYERMGSPPISVLRHGGRFDVDTPDGILLFDPGGKLLGTWRARRDEHGIFYSLDMCRCSHHADYHEDGGKCRSGDDDGGGYFDECGCDGFEAACLG